jgi:hypothetical protein
VIIFLFHCSVLVDKHGSNELSQMTWFQIPILVQQPKKKSNSSGRRTESDFLNLPAQCTVRIYTIAGALVKTAQDSAFSEVPFLNLVTEGGMDAAAESSLPR